jgi:mRNA interferase YafQ
MDLARVVMGRLIHRETLDPSFRDHALEGEWTGHRECHLEPDWLLIYRIAGEEITFERTGTHADLFDE